MTKITNPYTGMEIPDTSNNGNGEVVKVQDLIDNPPEPTWKPTVDTLENADSDTVNLFDKLSASPKEPVNNDIPCQLPGNEDTLIAELTNVLNS